MQRTYVVGVGWYEFCYPDARSFIAEAERGPGTPTGAVGGASAEASTMTNVEVAFHLAGKYPDRVEVVSLGG